MNLLGYILLAMMVAAAAQAIISALLVFLVVLVLWGLLFRTRETVGLLASMLVLQALTLHPWVTIGVSLALGAVVLIGRSIAAVQESSGRTDQPSAHGLGRERVGVRAPPAPRTNALECTKPKTIRSRPRPDVPSGK